MYDLGFGVFMVFVVVGVKKNRVVSVLGYGVGDSGFDGFDGFVKY